MSTRRFTEKETAEIMRRAAERQARGQLSSGGEGVSEAELKSAAKELGIESAAIDAALRDYDEVPMRVKPHFFGGPYHRDAEVVFDGVLNDERWEEVLLDIRKTFGEKGATEKRGSTYEWSGTGTGVDFNTVTLRQTGDSIRMKVTSNFSGLGVIGYMLGMLPMLIAVALVSKANFQPPYGFVVGSVFAFLFFLGIWIWTNSFSRQRQGDLLKLTRDVQNLVSLPLASVRENLAQIPESQTGNAAENVEVSG